MATRATPIFQTSSYVFEDADDAADLFALQKYGMVYTRLGNPTVSAFEERMASLEGGIGAVAASSGHAAEFLSVTALAGAGDHIVSSSHLYGGTITMFSNTVSVSSSVITPTQSRVSRSAVTRAPCHEEVNPLPGGAETMVPPGLSSADLTC